MQLIIIPGLGDRAWLYRGLVPLWALRGFKVRIMAFGWNNDNPYAEKKSRLLACIEEADAPVCIIGASAGGTAAVNALVAKPAKVAWVITVATPYSYLSGIDNQPLRESIAELKMNLRHMNAGMRGRIVSVHGKKDMTVPPRASQPPHIRHQRLNATGHGAVIFLALTVYAGRLRPLLCLPER